MSFFSNLFSAMGGSNDGDGDRASKLPSLLGGLITKPNTQDFPPTFGKKPGPDETHEKFIFDPALKHYLHGYRRGDPVLPPEQMQRWLAARREAMMHLLIGVGGSSWPLTESMVLRGSLALKGILGDQAREPGDIDWIVQPASVPMRSTEAIGLFKDVIASVVMSSKSELMEIDLDEITHTDIWTYDRAPGRRIAFPWRSGDLPPGVIQMDFVFEQPLYTPPQKLTIQLGQFSCLNTRCASSEESLAWKLLWLWSDMYPQGKDLYDAVLLAERFPLPGELLMRVLRDAEPQYKFKINPGFPFSEKHHAEPDWDNFKKECPWIFGTADAWKERLTEALKPTVEEIRVKNLAG